jgi:hypothetical protein
MATEMMMMMMIMMMSTYTTYCQQMQEYKTYATHLFTTEESHTIVKIYLQKHNNVIKHINIAFTNRQTSLLTIGKNRF